MVMDPLMGARFGMGGEFQTRDLDAAPTEKAPDGSEVRVLLRLEGGSMAHFSLPAGGVSAAVRHVAVEEIWYVVAGAGRIWRRRGAVEAVTDLVSGTCLTLPLGTEFQFRAAADQPLAVVAVTLPPWPGEGGAVPVQGPWPPEPLGCP
jgi:mannose-6-phosphate isomerase-like protein (cupin superfamily)